MAVATLPTDPALEALAWAHPIVREWFLTKFGSPTEPQIAGWPPILRGDPTLISAPTGSGKTLSAFLVCIDKLLRAAIEGRLAAHTHVVYISPLKALSNDIQKNLDAPLAEIQQLAIARGYLCPEIRTGVRTGDTLTKHRLAMLKHPPHILVTTPESLYILLTAGKSRQNLTRVQTVIVDEIHAIADDKRGAHLALTLERLDALVCGENRLSPGAFLAGLNTPPQRIGLSATQNPIELVAAFLTGTNTDRNNSELQSIEQSSRMSSELHPIEQSSRMSSELHPAEPSYRISSGLQPTELRAPTNRALALDNPRQPATIIQVGQRRTLDLAIEVPSAELTSITSIAMWDEIYDKLAALAQQHRSTLVFVNTRKLVEKISFELSNRLGEDAVAAHHGSLSRALRLDAEQRLKAGECKILIATASLELGIDIGTVDLVCQIATTRAVAVAMQRVGRAGHWRGAIPKGRFFATTRDDLFEQAALLRKMVAGELDLLEIPDCPIDVLMQQIVATIGAESWREDDLYQVLRRAYPYRNLTREQYEEVLALLHNGIENSRGRYGAYILRDQVQGHLHARRGSRSIAISNGGAIPDTSIFAVMLQPENVQIATLDEHFAVDSSPGDVILLGNTSWRIQRVDPNGKVLVEDAHGAPPSIPFWEGEAPQRTSVLSDGVSALRQEIDRRTSNLTPQHLSGLAFTGGSEPTVEGSSFTGLAAGFSPLSQPRDQAGFSPGLSATDPESQLHSTIAFLRDTCFLSHSAALQLITYIVHGRAVLGAVPTKTTLIAERFFDEGGGQQLILHAPFGGRLNKAWGLALRKRFCRGFTFELQAAATDNGINISLAEQHSFPLADVFHFLTTLTARELLEQASIPSPLFKNRWRWAAGRSLQLLRMQKGKRIAPQIQRTRSDDLLASVFPHASACPETMTGDIEIPDHPLVREVMKDTLTEAMDLEGLLEVLQGIAAGTIRCIAIDTPIPSVFAHELINAMPYAFLDPEDAAARRTRAVSTRGNLPSRLPETPGRLDPAAIATVRQQLWPDVRDEHELHDLLLQLIALPLHAFALSDETIHPGATENLGATTYSGSTSQTECTAASESLSISDPGFPASPTRISSGLQPTEPTTPQERALALGPLPAAAGKNTQHWPLFFHRLAEKGRAHCITLDGSPAWIATERLPEAAALWPGAPALRRHPETQPKDPRISPVEAATPGAPSSVTAPSSLKVGSRDSAHLTLTQGYLQLLGPTTSTHLATLTHLHPRDIHQSLLTMEMQGLALRGVFEHPTPPSDTPHEIEWCERRILQRIHRLTLGTLRKQVEPVTPAIFMRWLLDWHHLAPHAEDQPQPTGEEAVLAAIEQLEGFEAPAIEWERTLLPARIANYQPQWLDNLCLAGVLAWGRISPHPAWSAAPAPTPTHLSSRPKSASFANAAERPAVFAGDDLSGPLRQAPRRVIPTTAAPITFYLRDSSDWLHHALASKSIDEATLTQSLSPEAQTLRALLATQGAAFTADLQRLSGLTKFQTTTALWELATAGLAAADGFDQLRALMDPRRKSAATSSTPATSLRKRAAARTTAGRWSLLSAPATIPGAPRLASETWDSHNAPASTQAAIAHARQTDAALDAHARILLCRYGVLFRELLAREANAPKWRDLLPILRRLEARGEIRGGRFVSGPFGEQYALPEAADSLRKARTQHAARATESPIVVSAADPLNLAGILVPGDRIPAIPGRTVSFQHGITVEENPSPSPTAAPKPKAARTRSIPDMLRAESLNPRTPQPAPSPGLFS
ncbi:MAG TPA: DEAD/DEAH box helicase [Acidobacteriaceae bacterium]|nr:DEAD/DEAH box helicase [Acidobacteriaceae bacterium]